MLHAWGRDAGGIKEIYLIRRKKNIFGWMNNGPGEMKHLYSLPVIFAAAHFRLLATPRTIYAESTVVKKKGYLILLQ